MEISITGYQLILVVLAQFWLSTIMYASIQKLKIHVLSKRLAAVRASRNALKKTVHQYGRKY